MTIVTEECRVYSHKLPAAAFAYESHYLDHPVNMSHWCKIKVASPNSDVIGFPCSRSKNHPGPHEFRMGLKWALACWYTNSGET